MRRRDIPPRLVGPVEQVVCAAAHVFVATPLSTFSAFVHRLRGYVEAPDKNRYYHTEHTPGPRRYEGWPTSPFWGVEPSEMWDGLRR